MLLEFQQALADLVASPALCREVRANPSQLRERYNLSDREYGRLAVMVNEKGMVSNCVLYRANRLAPLALNLREFCRVLGPKLGPLLSEYSALYPNTNVHFYRECERFCLFVLEKMKEGYALEPTAEAIFLDEYSKIKADLVATYTAL
jgi:hypothetical protein